MFEYYEKRRLKRLLYSKSAVALLLVLILLLGSAVWDAYEKEKITREKRNLSVAEKEKLLERKEALENELERLSTERGVEEEVRSKFDAVREGEKIIVLVNAKDQGASALREEKQNLLERIRDFFGI
ncbi:MAG: hypothetical protein WDZ90_01070 [Candidatus Paceibacterota bacterium]